jgi:hypothetical protein
LVFAFSAWLEVMQSLAGQLFGLLPETLVPWQQACVDGLAYLRHMVIAQLCGKQVAISQLPR